MLEDCWRLAARPYAEHRDINQTTSIVKSLSSQRTRTDHIAYVGKRCTSQATLRQKLIECLLCLSAFCQIIALRDLLSAIVPRLAQILFPVDETRHRIGHKHRSTCRYGLPCPRFRLKMRYVVL